MTLQEFIKSVQHRPYEQRVRLLWLSSAISAVLLLLLWIGAAKLSAHQSALTDNPLVRSLLQQLELARQKFPHLETAKAPATPQEAAGLPRDFQVVRIRSFSLAPQLSELDINFIASNPTEDLMAFLNASRSNIYLQDGEARLQPLALRSGDAPYPSKILSQTSYPGQLTFQQPQQRQVFLIIENISLDQHPEIPFSQSVSLDLDHPAAGSTENSKPRD